MAATTPQPGPHQFGPFIRTSGLKWGLQATYDFGEPQLVIGAVGSSDINPWPPTENCIRPDLISALSYTSFNTAVGWTNFNYLWADGISTPLRQTGLCLSFTQRYPTTDDTPEPGVGGEGPVSLGTSCHSRIGYFEYDSVRYSQTLNWSQIGLEYVMVYHGAPVGSLGTLNINHAIERNLPLGYFVNNYKASPTGVSQTFNDVPQSVFTPGANIGYLRTTEARGCQWRFSSGDSRVRFSTRNGSYVGDLEWNDVDPPDIGSFSLTLNPYDFYHYALGGGNATITWNVIAG